MSKPAIIYARFSTTEQSKGYSLERQTKLAIEFAAKHDWIVEKTITDQGRSAFHGANRLEGSALSDFELEAKKGLHAGKVLVVENIDRLSRQGAKAAAQLVWALNGYGVDVATFHDSQIYGAGNGDMMELFGLIVKAQLAYEESEKKSQRTKASWKNRFEAMEAGTQKRPIPHTPNWIDRIEGGFVLNRHRTAVLNEIYDLYIDGVGIHSIVTILNGRGEPDWSGLAKKKTQGGWFYSIIHRLLHKRSVLGEYVKGDGTLVAADFYPQAITTEKFNRAQAALAMRKSNAKPAANRQHSILTCLVFCGECGGGAHFEQRVGRQLSYTRTNGELRTYWVKEKRSLRCDRARRNHACSNDAKLSYDVVETTILDELLPQLVTRPSANLAAQQLRERIAEVVRQQETTQAKLNNIIEAIEDGGSKALVQRMGTLEARLEQQGTEIETLQAKLDMETSKPAHHDDVALVESLRAELDSDDPEIRRYARSRVNMGLRRLLHRIDIEATNTFRIWPDEDTWWWFDENGTLLDGEYRLNTGLSAEGLALLKQDMMAGDEAAVA